MTFPPTLEKSASSREYLGSFMTYCRGVEQSYTKPPKNRPKIKPDKHADQLMHASPLKTTKQTRQEVKGNEKVPFFLRQPRASLRDQGRSLAANMFDCG